MKLNLLLPLAACLSLPSPLLAGERPDTTGTWLIDPVKSNMGPVPVPDDLRLDIRDEGENLSVRQSGGGQAEFDLRFNTAGKEATNPLPGAKMTSTHRWEGAILIGAIKIDAEDGSSTIFKDRISFSLDGKVMTMTRNMSGPTGEAQMTLVLNKK